MRRVRVVVSGHVQGVFFRDTLSREASAAGAGGWVRNREDGTVEAVFEGDPEVVERMIELCRRGSPEAEVSGVEVEEAEPEGVEGFTVR